MKTKGLMLSVVCMVLGLVWMAIPAVAQPCEWASGFQLRGMDSSVDALTVFDDGTGGALYAGGFLTTAGGVVANRIARWDGKEWSPLGSGMNSPVSALTVFDDGTGPALYAGGRFAMAGGVEANYIAKWDGKEWSPLGSGMGGGPLALLRVSALTVFDDGTGAALYAGGWFITAGGVAARSIAKWDSTEWSPLGSGMSGGLYPSVYVSALTVFDDGTGAALYAGGSFAIAGGRPSARIAAWHCTMPSRAKGEFQDIYEQSD